MKNKSMQLKIWLSVFILVVLGYFFVVSPILKIKAESKVLITKAKALKSVFAQNNIDLVNKNYKDFEEEYKKFTEVSSSIYWASIIPYVADFKNMVEAGDYLVKAGHESLIAITPYADLIGFKKGEQSFVEKSAEDRLQTAVLTLDKVLGRIDYVSSDINEAEKRIMKINPNIYPGKIGNVDMKGTLINVKEQFKGMSSLFVDAKPLIKKLPMILGSKKEQTYLLLFQNDKERRATGGFLTFVSVFKIKGGKLSISNSQDIYTLDDSIGVHPTAPREILTYHKGVSQFFIRDSNLSPDFPASIKLFESLYVKSGSRAVYDGIIAVDSKILVDMLTIFGDTEAGGLTFSARTDKRCDCAQVLYQLFDIVDRPVGYLKVDRKAILGDLMYALFYKAIGFSPSRYWGTLISTMYINLQEKHIQLNFKDQEIQSSIEKLNFAGKINTYTGDYLHINNVNFAGAKSNLFVTESVTSIANKSGDLINREVKVDYRNPYPASDCNLERGNLCLNAILRNWVRLYVPLGSKLVAFKGSTKKVQTYDELGKTVFEGYLEVPTEGKASIDVTYTLPKELSNASYSLLMQKQGGVDSQKLEVKYNGSTLFKGDFRVDQVFKSL